MKKRGHIDRSVCQSVDQVLFTQYLLIPLLESCQTWYGEYPIAVGFPFGFQVMVKGQGQNVSLCTNVVCSISFNPFEIANLVQ